MRLLHIPLQQLRAMARACPGLMEAITTAVEDGVDPAIRVVRVSTEGEPPRWYLATGGQRTLVLDAADLAAMAAVVPIYFLDLVQEIRVELQPLFDDGSLDAEIDKLVPFGSPLRGRGRPS